MMDVHIMDAHIMEWTVLFLKILSGVLRSAVCLFLICRILHLERPKRRALLIGEIGTAAIVFGAESANVTQFYQGILIAVLLAVCAGWTQRDRIRMSLFISIFYEIAVTFWQFLFSAGLGAALGADAFLNDTGLYSQTGSWILNLCLAVLVFFVMRHPDMTEKEGFGLASGIAVAGFIAVVTLGGQTAIFIPKDTVYMWTILSVILMMAILVMNISRRYEAEKELARLKSEQAELLERDYTTLNQVYSVNARLFHDFRNHIGVLRQFLTHEKYRDAIAYLDELQTPLREMTDTVWTGDETVDYLINSKMAASSERQIRMQAEVEFPRHTNIRSADLCAILGNLLDNALEAAEKVTSKEKRSVTLTIRRINQMLVMKVENSYAQEPQTEKGQLKTTKTDGGLHGWGLKSAQTAAGKYDGTIRTFCEDGYFKAVATLSFHGVTKE